MFTTHLETFKIQEKELHHQAAQYRFAKSLEENNALINRISESLGRFLIHSGQQFIKNSRATAH